MSDFITHPFYKMHGAGNDFIMFDNRSGWMAPDAYEKFRKLCQLHTGIGADGLMLLSESDSADFKLDYFNADGYPGNMCGNGARCAVFLAHTLGIAPARCSFEINRVHYQAEVQQNRQVRLRMQMPEIVMESQELSSLLPGQFDMAYWVDTGVAHLVVKSNDPLEQVDVNKWGSYLRHHWLFRPDGVNVNFVYPGEHQSFHARVYEKGVEAETLACGTGAVACGFFAAKELNWTSPVSVIFPGGELRVEFENDFQGTYLNGAVSLVFEGRLSRGYLEGL